MYGHSLFFDFNILLAIILVTLCIMILVYYQYTVLPYALFPSVRKDYRFLYYYFRKKIVSGSVFNAYLRYCKRYEKEGMFIFWLFKPILVIYGEEIVKCINQDASITDRPSFYKLHEFALGKGLLTSEGENWKRQKKVVLPAFHARALKTYTSVMNENARILVEKLSDEKNKTVDDIIHILAECSLRILLESNFGVTEKNREEDEYIIKGYKSFTEFIINRSSNPWLRFDFTLHILPHARKMLKVKANIIKKFVQILENIKKSTIALESSKYIPKESDNLDSKPKSIGELIVDHHLKHPSFSLEELADEIIFLVGAGFETQANNLMWCFFMLGIHQHIQERLYEEISAVEEKYIEFKDVQNLKLLDCVIKETLRLYTVPVIGRRLNKDVQFRNYLIPKNTDISIIIYALHRNPDIYPDPEEFRPERFMDENSKIKPWNYIPFAEGARPCIGKNYALISMKIIMIYILRNFKIISLDRVEDIEFVWSTVLSCKKCPRLQFVPRELSNNN